MEAAFVIKTPNLDLPISELRPLPIFRLCCGIGTILKTILELKLKGQLGPMHTGPEHRDVGCSGRLGTSEGAVWWGVRWGCSPEALLSMASPWGRRAGSRTCPGRRVGSYPGVSSLGPSLASGMQEGESDDAESDGETEAWGELAQMPGWHWDQPHALPSAQLWLRPESTGPGRGWNGPDVPACEAGGAWEQGSLCSQVHLFDEFVIT